MAFMPIQLAALTAPYGIRHCWSPPTRPPMPPSWSTPAVVCHTVRKQSTWRQSPLATAIIALRIDPPGPGTSGPPQIHVGRSRNASSSAVMPPSLKPISYPIPPGYVARPSMSSGVRPASAIAARLASTVSDSGLRINRRPMSDRPIPEMIDLCS